MKPRLLMAGYTIIYIIYGWRGSALAAAVILLAASWGCGGNSQEAAMRRLESRLLQAPSISMLFHITSLGVREANLTGRLSLALDGHINIEVEGMIGGTEVKARLTADISSLLISNNGDLTEAVTPEMLREAIIIGFTRMGLMHNLARLARSEPPDRADGGVSDWVRYEMVNDETVPKAEIMGKPLGFDTTVSGELRGRAWLWLDRGTGLPVVRRQTVSFDDGEMVVVEHYNNFTLGDD